MKNSKSSRRTAVLTSRSRLERLRKEIAAELPDLSARDRMRKEARDEPTLSGEIRRAIRASSLPLAEIAKQARIPSLVLDEFLTGERTLRSDVLDRVAGSVQLEFAPR